VEESRGGAYFRAYFRAGPRQVEGRLSELSDAGNGIAGHPHMQNGNGAIKGNPTRHMTRPRVRAKLTKDHRPLPAGRQHNLAGRDSFAHLSCARRSRGGARNGREGKGPEESRGPPRFLTSAAISTARGPMARIVWEWRARRPAMGRGWGGGVPAEKAPRPNLGCDGFARPCEPPAAALFMKARAPAHDPPLPATQFTC
jgi:hypothetical protein